GAAPWSSPPGTDHPVANPLPGTRPASEGRTGGKGPLPRWTPAGHFRLCSFATPEQTRRMLTPAPSATTRHAGSDSGNGSTRREFIRTTGRIAAASALAGAALPHVHASSESAVRLALIGCGGRGNGAVADAMTAAGLRPDDPDGRERAERSGAAGPLRLHAMADIRQDRLDGSHDALKRALGDLVDVPPERRFLGFDAYRHAIDSLRPGDIAILATFSSFRPIHLEYAVQKGVHVFMEKCFAPDPGGIHRLIRAGEAAEARNLKIAAGLMC